MRKVKKREGKLRNEKKNRIVIQGELMDLNNFIDKQRANRFGGANAKKKETDKCAIYIKQAMNQGLSVGKLPIHLNISWYMQNKRKDKDNIAFAKKFILDGMIQAKLIRNDGWKEISGFTDEFHVDKNNPRVEVTIYEFNE